MPKFTEHIIKFTDCRDQELLIRAPLSPGICKWLRAGGFFRNTYKSLD